MAFWNRTVMPSQKIKLEDYLDGFDVIMNNVIMIGEALYKGYLSDKLLKGGRFGYLVGFHDYKVYTSTKDGIPKRKKTLRIPKVTSQFLIKKIYTENIAIKAESQSQPEIGQKIDSFIQEIIERENYFQHSAEATEKMFNLGGKIERPRVENGKIVIDYLNAKNFHPTEFDNSGVKSGYLWTIKKKNGYYYTKIIKIVKNGNNYDISKELFKSKDGIYLGDKIPYNSMYDDAEKYTLNNFKSVPFTYTKVRQANDIVFGSPLGVPFWFAAIDTIEHIDTSFHQGYREMKYGGRTRVVPSYAMTKTVVKDASGERYTSTFDPDDETIKQLNFPDNNLQQKFEDVTAPIRNESIIAMINHALDIYAFQTGFTVGTFRFDGKSIKTATEVISEKEDTYQLIVGQEKNLAAGHKNLFMSCVELANALQLDDRVRVIPDDLKIITEFDDSILVDDQQFLKDMREDVIEGIVAPYRYVAKKYKLTETEAKEWVAEAETNNSLNQLLGIEALEDEPTTETPTD